MKKIIILFTILILIFLSKYLTSKFFNKTVSTQIITYIPEDREYPTKSGECNQLSTATQGRSNTYRCYVDNGIYDPCFKVESGKIVCDSNPKANGNEFKLIVSKALPESDRQYHEDKQFDWAYELQDGTICFLIQGTAGSLNNDEMYFYGCEYDTVIIGDINKDNQLWVAKVGKLDEGSSELLEPSFNMNILKSWK